MPPVVLILASGRGERFRASGGSTHKLQARLGDRSVLEHTLQAVRDSGLPFHLEDAGHPGMGDSIAAAVRATADADGWLILPADLPLVLPSTLRAVTATLGARPPASGSDAEAGRRPGQTPVDASMRAVVPVFEGQRGHPVGFSRGCGARLMALAGDRGAAPVLRACAVTELALADAGCVTDVDTLELLAAAERLWRARQGG